MTIFITVKKESKRCPNKNLILLPYVLNNFSNYLKEIIVITDSVELKKIAEDFGVKETFLEDKRVQVSEFNSIYNYLSKNNKFSEISEFIYLPVTQPFSSEELLNNISSLDLSDYDFSTTYSIIPDRKIFLLNNDNSFKYNSYERKGSLCGELKMIDGAIYRIKTEFLEKIISSDNINHCFWNESKILFLENNNLFLDIDTPRDLFLFQEIIKNKS